MIHPLYDILKEIVGENQKAVAHDVWPESTQATAEASLTKVLQGDGNIPPGLLDLALQKPRRRLLLDYVEGKAAADPAALRQKALDRMVAIAEDVASVKEMLGEADELESLERRVVRVEPGEKRRRA